MKIKIKIKFTKQIDDTTWVELLDKELEVEDGVKGCRSALLGWCDSMRKRIKDLYMKQFGEDFEETNMKFNVSVLDNGVEVLNDGNGFYVHFFGQRKFVTTGIKAVSVFIHEEVCNFIKTYLV